MRAIAITDETTYVAQRDSIDAVILELIRTSDATFASLLAALCEAKPFEDAGGVLRACLTSLRARGFIHDSYDGPRESWQRPVRIYLGSCPAFARRAQLEKQQRLARVQ